MTDKKEKITIMGAGPVGSLLSIYLSKQNYKVTVFEKREDLRLTHKAEGRSINIALSQRGLRALHEIGVAEKIKEIAVPMKGRMIHDQNGKLNFQPYGEEGQFINSISRNQLNEILLDKAEKECGVDFRFQNPCINVKLDKAELEFDFMDRGWKESFQVLFGADGAGSVVRSGFSKNKNFSSTTQFLSHGYKELHIPASKEGKHVIEKNALHIWPRDQFMLIALPNMDGSFTATLFLPFIGENSFEGIKTSEDAEKLFKKFFSDVVPIIPDLAHDYFELTPSRLVTVHCYPWIYNNNVALIGDAAHAITPFYGQGMNAGFEDCRILNEIIRTNKYDWKTLLEKYQQSRKGNADAIAELALQNFIEMRDLVGDERFLLRKKIESEIHRQFPQYLPLYSMVTFSDLPYAEALAKGKEHDEMMGKVMAIPGIEKTWDTENGWKEINTIINTYIKKG
ncbi:MAG: FAD-dependent monooxygenase [Cytophagaceae bacterium]|nr:FAD-dependent monooxygenase [Cytophagaceae bacterium]